MASEREILAAATAICESGTAYHNKWEDQSPITKVLYQNQSRAALAAAESVRASEAAERASNVEKYTDHADDARIAELEG